MLVNPGDLVVGDADGLTCVPLERVQEVYAQAAKNATLKPGSFADTLTGKLDPKAWVDEALKQLGCEGL